MTNINTRLALFFLVPLSMNWLLTFWCVSSGLSVIVKPGTTVVILETLLILAAVAIAIIARSFIKNRKPNLTLEMQNALLAFSLAILGSGLILTGLWSGALLGEFNIWIYVQDFQTQIVACILAVLQSAAGYFAMTSHRIDEDGTENTSKSATKNATPA